MKGRLLLASPALTEPTFHRTVVYLAEHQPEGAFGVILNRPSGHKVGDLVNDPDFASIFDFPVYHGGPVEDHTLMFLAFWWNPAKDTLETEKLTSVAQAASYQALNDPRLFVRVFAGHSGWSEGQLDGELLHNAWLTESPTDALLVEPHDESLWEDVLIRSTPLNQLVARCKTAPSNN